MRKDGKNLCDKCGVSMSYTRENILRLQRPELGPHTKISSNHVERVIGLWHLCDNCLVDFNKVTHDLLEFKREEENQ